MTPNSWNNDILSYIAASAGGDARKAIQILHNAAVAAELDGSTRIRRKHVRRSWRVTRSQEIERGLESLTGHQRIIYDIVNQNNPINSRALRKAYLKRCAAEKLKAVAQRIFSGYVRKLAVAHLVTLDRAPIRGRCHLVMPAQ